MTAMKNGPINLTNAWISKAKASTKFDSIQGDSKVTGLKIRITQKGTKTFYYFYKTKSGRQGKYRIGAFGNIGVPEARDIAKKLAAEVMLGSDPQGEKVAAKKHRREEKKNTENTRLSKLGVFLEEKYYPHVEAQKKRSIGNTKYIMKLNFSFLNSIQMDQITSWQIDKWQKKRLDSGIKGTTINRALTALMAVLNLAVKQKVISENPLAERDRIKTDKKGVIRWLSEDEEKRLYAALAKRTGHLPVIITLLLNTGARPREIFTLRWENVDLVKKSITLEAAFTKTGQTRYIPLNDTAFNALSNWQSDGEWVFPGVGPRSHIVSIQRGWGLIKKEAKITKFRLYDCRHTFASKLVRNGVAIYEVAELLGHSAIEMTKIYAHLDDQTLRNAVSKVG